MRGKNSTSNDIETNEIEPSSYVDRRMAVFVKLLDKHVEILGDQRLLLAESFVGERVREISSC